MKILVTGGLGGIGKAVVAEGLARGHSMAVFDLDTGRNRKAARRLG
jgi:nucleoside-diphosphate-sugar epimerase